LLPDGAIAFALPPDLTGQTRIFTLKALRGMGADGEGTLRAEPQVRSPEHSALSIQHFIVRAIQAQPERSS
jgi:hypothetical protein